MFRVSIRVSAGFRLAIVTLAAAMAVLTVTSDGAEARRKQRHVSKSHVNKSDVAKSRVAIRVKKARERKSAGRGYSPASASIVVDGNSGKVLEATNPDSLRHPASLTKIMTLYLLFERLEAGKMKLETEMKVSERASEQAPTKLGLKPGQTIDVEDAIKGLVTKSANDAAVVVAEAIGGSEDEFARMMTAKARTIGMSRTVYRNASGLPDDEQVSTARDQALLGRAIQERFPRYYKYFSTTSFRYRGEAMRNHNKLLGRVEGVDGIKTGYTQASGFNLVTSVRRGNRHIVAVVLGGRSANSRDARMRDLIEDHIAEASQSRGPAIVAQPTADAIAPAVSAARSDELTEQPARQRVAQAANPAPSINERFTDAAPTSAIPAARPAPGSDMPIKPVRVKTISVKSGTTQAVQGTALTPMQIAPSDPVPVTARTKSPLVVPVSAPSETAPPPARTQVVSTMPTTPTDPVEPAAEPTRSIATPSQDAPTMRAASAPAAPKAAPELGAPERRAGRGGWAIQIGAFEAEGEARDKLTSAQSKAKDVLSHADPYTETVTKGDKTLYRARFAGFDRDSAEAACKFLKKNEFQCMALKN